MEKSDSRMAEQTPEQRQTENRLKRERFFQANLVSFFESQSKSIAEGAVTGLDRSMISLVMLENAQQIVNIYYWEFIDKYVRTRLFIDNPESDSEKLVDVYKILSATEYAIMSVKPFALLKHNKELDYLNETDLFQIELDINATFAFMCAYNLLTQWGSEDNSYKNIFMSEEVKDFIFGYIEDIEERVDAMTLGFEHIRTVALSSIDNPSPPIFSNANWWRLFCLCGYLKRG